MLYFAYQLNSCGSIEARHTSVPSHQGTGIPWGERVSRRSCHCRPGVVAGSSENICRTVTFRGVLSFYVFRVLLPVAVNVDFLRIHGFLLINTYSRKEREL